MKKLKVVAIILALVMAMGLLGGCSLQASKQDNGDKIYQGVGQVPSFRVGPGKDDKDVQVYSFNYVTADAIFDGDGKIINVYFDALEVSSPNYDGESMPHFSGWPGTQGYNVTDHATAKVSGVSNNTEDAIKTEVDGWKSKRERGDAYGMNPNNDWHKQADFYQDFFKGKTIAEIEDWFTKYTSDKNRRPLKAEAKDEKDKAKYDALSDKEKKDLADVTSGATMSISDAHGDLLAALKKAYETRFEISIPK